MSVAGGGRTEARVQSPSCALAVGPGSSALDLPSPIGQWRERKLWLVAEPGSWPRHLRGKGGGRGRCSRGDGFLPGVLCRAGVMPTKVSPLGLSRLQQLGGEGAKTPEKLET